MRTRPWATGRHLPYRIAKCCLPPDTSEHTRLNHSQTLVLDLPAPEGWKAELTGYPAMHFTSRESNSQCFDHNFDALTTTLLSHRISWKRLEIRDSVPIGGAPIGNGIWGIGWSHDWWRHVRLVEVTVSDCLSSFFRKILVTCLCHLHVMANSL